MSKKTCFIIISALLGMGVLYPGQILARTPVQAIPDHGFVVPDHVPPFGTTTYWFCNDDDSKSMNVKLGIYVNGEDIPLDEIWRWTEWTFTQPWTAVSPGESLGVELTGLQHGMFLYASARMVYSTGNSEDTTESRDEHEQQEEGSVRARGDSVKAAKSFKIHNDTQEIATDLHFVIWQKESNIHIVNWDISVEGGGFQDSTQVIAADSHSVACDYVGGGVAPCDTVKVDATLWLTDWNTVRIKDVEWTFEPYFPPTIPTLTQWGMIIFALLILASGVWMLRRRRRLASLTD